MYKLFAQQRKSLEKKNEKTTYRVGENNCKWWKQQGPNLQNMQTIHTTQQPKK